MHLELCEIGVGLASHVPWVCRLRDESENESRPRPQTLQRQRSNAPPRAATYVGLYTLKRAGGGGVCPPLEVTHEASYA